jgi:hypothetical protein
MIAYEKIRGQIESKKVFDSVNLTVENPLPNLKLKNIGRIEKFQLISMYLLFIMHNNSVSSYFKTILSFFEIRKGISLKEQFKTFPSNIRKKIKEFTLKEFPEKHRFFTPIVNYLIKTHIRRQLKNLHKLYLRELITQNILKNKEEINELKKINDIIKEYINELPDIKRFFFTLASIMVGIITIGQFFGLDDSFKQIISAEYDLIIILIVAIPMITGFVISEIFSNSFRIKRQLMMNTIMANPCFDFYFGKGKEIYNNSVYKIEDELYEKLGRTNKKPKEIPIDKILKLIIPGSILLFYTGLVVIGFIIALSTGKTIPNGFQYILPVIFLMTFIFVGTLMIKYRRRVKNQLQ